MKKSIKVLTGMFLIGISLLSCNSATEKEKAVEKGIAVGENNQISYQVGDHLPNDLVCMVNNAYMGKPQLPVPVEGKTYYGCCDMCVGKLNNDESARMAQDPFTGKPVDKSTSYIVLTSKEGAVAYFESEESYKDYKIKNKSIQ
ncbi:hypothetical protein FHG64_13045 [Antarcticibacterium flavum]|uniref:MlpB protein n=1 Tax=Antarcticibacterium flavum TaxID=2058175 RepID=A0A5B7X439_9FLAO|nr:MULTISPECIES: hypothetical protein [Antarcticibacterium]MCM4158504.1 hypothetical protein [Antarcticibacterium sp. W02-3]QCY70254.1 hypothetical protein FHG64_13045 [Antarcticibacterium flavum]